MLFIDYSSVFNTIVPSKLINKLRTLGLNTCLCNWILDFLMGRPQVVRVGNNTSATLILNTGAPHEEGSAYSPVHHWGHASCHLGPLYQAESEEGPKNNQRHKPP
jgi:hypothetical protein